MIRITRQTDYGIILLSHLAHQPERVANAAELAAETWLPVPMVGKVLKRLTHEGLLVSQRGMRGGYALARPAEDISVAEVIAALEGPIALTDCIAEGPGSCDREAHCPTRGHWHQINTTVYRALAGLSLASMAQTGPSLDTGTGVIAGMGGSEGSRPIQITDRDLVLAEITRHTLAADPGHDTTSSRHLTTKVSHGSP